MAPRTKMPKNTVIYSISRQKKGYKVLMETFRTNEMSWTESEFPTLASAIDHVTTSAGIKRAFGYKTKVNLPKKRRIKRSK